MAWGNLGWASLRGLVRTALVCCCHSAMLHRGTTFSKGLWWQCGHGCWHALQPSLLLKIPCTRPHTSRLHSPCRRAAALQVVLRVWDCVVVEGPKVALRVALAIIKVCVC